MGEVITKSSYIVGVIREMDILGSLVTFKSPGFKTKTLVQLPFDLSPGAGIEKFEIMSIPKDVTSGEILFEIDNSILKAEVKREGELFLLPRRLEVCDSRETDRLKREMFYDSTVFLEMRGLGRKLYGELVNTDEQYLLLQCSNTSTRFSPGETVEIRGYIKSGGVLNRTGLVSKVRKSENNISYVIDLKEEKRSVEARSPRIALEKSHVVVGKWPDNNSYKFEFELVDVGFLGFKGRVLGDTKTLPPLGSMITIGEFKARARLVWRSESYFGCDVSFSDDKSVGEWQEFVQEKIGKSFGSYSSGVRNKRILNIFLRSGYLRKHKAHVFGQSESIHEILPSDPKINSWLQRYGNATIDSGFIDTHISFLRLTDRSWLIQEASSMSLEKGVGKDLILRNIDQFYNRNLKKFDLGSCIFALYDANMSFNKRFWDILDSKPYVRTYDTLVYDFCSHQNDVGKVKLTLELPTFQSWMDLYSDLSSGISRDLLNVFNVREEGWGALHLEGAMSDSGYGLDRKVHVVRYGDEIVGVGVQFGLPTIANVTSTANHLYVLLKEEFSKYDALAEGLFQAGEGNDYISGVTEVVFVKNEIKETAFEPPKKRYFKLKTLNCLSLKKLVRFLEGDGK